MTDALGCLALGVIVVTLVLGRWLKVQCEGQETDDFDGFDHWMIGRKL